MTNYRIIRTETNSGHVTYRIQYSNDWTVQRNKITGLVQPAYRQGDWTDYEDAGNLNFKTLKEARDRIDLLKSIDIKENLNAVKKEEVVE